MFATQKKTKTESDLPDTLGDPGIFTIIIIFFPFWWLSCN